jgi:histidyl-tRNA synthetase
LPASRASFTRRALREGEGDFMAKMAKQDRPKPRLPKGLRDIEAAEIRGVKQMLRTIEAVYESYGFEPVETPMIEYTDALGKFLPDQDRPNEGVFSFQDDDEQWLSLRYDLTAPLARYVAENYQDLPKPYRSYRSGWVFRNEKPGPGRYRQFMQFDADTVGTASRRRTPRSACWRPIRWRRWDRARRLRRQGQQPPGPRRRHGDHRDRRRGQGEATRLTVMRAIDKLDRLGVEGVEGAARRRTQGRVRRLHEGSRPRQGADRHHPRRHRARPQHRGATRLDTSRTLSKSETRPGRFAGRSKPSRIVVRAAGYGPDRIRIDPTVVRGLEYYTGAVFEAELTFETTDETGRPVRFGSVGGGGRYDDLVARFRGELVPATGFSIGVSRLYAALKALGRVEEGAALAPVVVLVMDRESIGEHQRLVSELRNAGVRAELYLGTSGMKAQMKYADKRGAPCVVIQGDDERARGEVQIKDLVQGAQMAEGIDSREEWREARPAQVSVPEAEMVSAVKDVLARHAR